jgi:hypothetical protein
MAAPERFAESQICSCTAGTVHTWPLASFRGKAAFGRFVGQSRHGRMLSETTLMTKADIEDPQPQFILASRLQNGPRQVRHRSPNRQSARSFHKTHRDRQVYRPFAPPREAFCTWQAAV